MAQFSIKDLSEFSGLKQHTIRIWEQRYSFLQPQRSPSAHRTYTAEELNVLLDAALLNQNGYKVSVIDKMQLEKKLQIFSRMVDQQQKAVHDLIICMAKMDLRSFEKTMEQATESWGLHAALQQVLLPFCERIGLWQNGSSRNYMENIILVRQCIRHYLIAGIEKARPVLKTKKSVLLFLAAGQVQDLPLLNLQYLLQASGIDTLNLGPQVLPEQLEIICNKFDPDYILCHMGKGINGSRELCSFVSRIPLTGNTWFVSMENMLPGMQFQPRYRFVAHPLEAVKMIQEEALSAELVA